MISLQGVPSATSLMVKSNSLRATKSTAPAAMRLFSGSTATLAPMKPILTSGLIALIISAVLHVRLEGRGGGVHHHEIAVLDLRYDVLERQAVRRRVDQLRALDQSRRLRQPGRDTRRSAPRASSGSGRRRRRRSRRMTADAGTGFSLRQILQKRVNGSITSDPIAVVPPVHAASGETPSPESQAESVPERQHQKVRGAPSSACARRMCSTTLASAVTPSKIDARAERRRRAGAPRAAIGTPNVMNDRL